MKHKLLIAAAATALMAAPSFASAQDSFSSVDEEGWYLKAMAGYGIGTDIDITGGIDSSQHGNGIQAEGDVVGNLGVGYDFGENWRLELDGTTMFNDYGSISQTPSSFAKLRTDAVMLNALYDFDEFGKFAPYVGAGVGLVFTDATIAAHDFPEADNSGQLRNPVCVGDRPSIAGFSCEYSDRDSGLGWQLLAGLGYDITDKLTWDTNYRYLQASDASLDGAIINAATGAFTSGQADVDGIGAHQLLTGFRYRFGGDAAPAAPVQIAPPPPPPPPVATADFRCWDGSFVFDSAQCPSRPVVQAQPEVQCWDGSLVFDLGQCPARPAPQVACPDGSFVSDINFCPTRGDVSVASLCGEQYKQEIIYYEFNKGASAETRNTINRILDTGEFCDVSSIRVVGHTDTSGAASYNLALSKRRATDALNELVRQGVNRNIISAEGKGETEPFVQTGDGVKEQLNRRTEVQITLGSIGAVVN